MTLDDTSPCDRPCHACAGTCESDTKPAELGVAGGDLFSADQPEAYRALPARGLPAGLGSSVSTVAAVQRWWIKPV